MTPKNPARCKNAAPKQTMNTQRFDRVAGAARGIAAALRSPEENAFQGRNHPLVNPHQADGCISRESHDNSRSNLPCRAALIKSRSTSAKALQAMDCRATRTISNGREKSCWCRRNASRSSLRARERTTALPIFREVTTPSREGPDPPSASLQFKIKQPFTNRWPSRRTRSNSQVRSSRCSCEKERVRPAEAPPAIGD